MKETDSNKIQRLIERAESKWDPLNRNISLNELNRIISDKGEIIDQQDVERIHNLFETMISNLVYNTNTFTVSIAIDGIIKLIERFADGNKVTDHSTEKTKVILSELSDEPIEGKKVILDKVSDELIEGLCESVIVMRDYGKEAIKAISKIAKNNMVPDSQLTRVYETLIYHASDKYILGFRDHAVAGIVSLMDSGRVVGDLMDAFEAFKKNLERRVTKLDSVRGIDLLINYEKVGRTTEEQEELIKLLIDVKQTTAPIRGSVLQEIDKTLSCLMRLRIPEFRNLNNQSIAIQIKDDLSKLTTYENEDTTSTSNLTSLSTTKNTLRNNLIWNLNSIYTAARSVSAPGGIVSNSQSGVAGGVGRAMESTTISILQIIGKLFCFLDDAVQRKKIFHYAKLARDEYHMTNLSRRIADAVDNAVQLGGVLTVDNSLASKIASWLGRDDQLTPYTEQIKHLICNQYNHIEREAMMITTSLVVAIYNNDIGLKPLDWKYNAEKLTEVVKKIYNVQHISVSDRRDTTRSPLYSTRASEFEDNQDDFSRAQTDVSELDDRNMHEQKSDSDINLLAVVDILYNNSFLNHKTILHQAYKSMGMKAVNDLIELGTEKDVAEQVLFAADELGVEKVLEILFGNKFKASESALLQPTEQKGSSQDKKASESISDNPLPTAYIELKHLNHIGFNNPNLILKQNALLNKQPQFSALENRLTHILFADISPNPMAVSMMLPTHLANANLNTDSIKTTIDRSDNNSDLWVTRYRNEESVRSNCVGL